MRIQRPQFPNYGKLPQLWTAPAAPLGGQVYEQNGQYYQQQRMAHLGDQVMETRAFDPAQPVNDRKNVTSCDSYNLPVEGLNTNAKTPRPMVISPPDPR